MFSNELWQLLRAAVTGTVLSEDTRAERDPFDVDVRIAHRIGPVNDQPIAAGSIFGSCHSCRCSGPGCR
jgi:hypothetical protein